MSLNISRSYDSGEIITVAIRISRINFLKLFI